MKQIKIIILFAFCVYTLVLNASRFVFSSETDYSYGEVKNKQFSSLKITPLSKDADGNRLKQIKRYANCDDKMILEKDNGPINLNTLSIKDTAANMLCASPSVRQSNSQQSNDDEGRMFTAKTVEGIDMCFQVIDENNKTCRVCREGNYFGACSIDTTTYGKITVPQTVNGYSVIEIGEQAFFSCQRLTSISIPNGVKTIESHAFAYCRRLESFTFPTSVTSIGQRAFADCSTIKELYLPASITNFYINSFESCSGLESIVVDSKSTWLDSRNGCNAIINTNKNILYLGCKNTVIPETVVAIYNYAFYGCEELQTLDLPKSVRSIGDKAFWFCKKLKSINLSSVETIGEWAFVNCQALESLFIPESVKSIGDCAFKGCALSLWDIKVSENNGFYDSRNDCNAIIETSANKLILGCQNTVIPDDITEIATSAFEDCIWLYSIEIPQSVKSIGEYAFDCRNLILCKSNITSPFEIDEWTFGILGYPYEDALLLVPKGKKNSYAKTKGWNNFRHITEEQVLHGKIDGENYVLIPDCEDADIYYTLDGTEPSVSPWSWGTYKAKGELSFDGTQNVKAIAMSLEHDYYAYFGGLSEEEQKQFNGDVFTSKTVEGIDMRFKVVSDTEKTCRVYEECVDTMTTGVITIPSLPNGYKVVGIGKQAFYGCRYITGIHVPDDVAYIGEYAFYGCEALSHINIPNSLTIIDDGVFEWCSNLQSINLPDGVKTIGYAVFAGCESLKTISLPNSLTAIGDYAFTLCSSLTSANIPANVHTIGEQAFSFNPAIKVVTMSNSVTEIGEAAFAECTSMESVTMSTSISSLSYLLFYDCI